MAVGKFMTKLLKLMSLNYILNIFNELRIYIANTVKGFTNFHDNNNDKFNITTIYVLSYDLVATYIESVSYLIATLPHRVQN